MHKLVMTVIMKLKTMTVFFVNTNIGNDSNVSTEDCPFATIAKAAETIGNGDTVIISHGITGIDIITR